ncbi:hypothetical protein F5X99DRAFT_212343 [Biscogniauxia marginata]|nr:hypothetical protein F5X99DRAFT_212343 [Biscogniauxia marginata]
MARVTGQEKSQLVTDTFNWEAEAEIPSHVLEAARSQDTSVSSLPRYHHRQIVLTGVTGFLGSEIFRYLIKDDDVAKKKKKIHCVEVPPTSKHKLPSDNKVVAHVGSLLSPNLGQAQSELQELQSCLDQVIHAGAQGHCLNN